LRLAAFAKPLDDFRVELFRIVVPIRVPEQITRGLPRLQYLPVHILIFFADTGVEFHGFICFSL